MRMVKSQHRTHSRNSPYYELSRRSSRIAAIRSFKRVGTLPATNPEPIRVDRFIEKRFGVVPEDYDDLPPWNPWLHEASAREDAEAVGRALQVTCEEERTLRSLERRIRSNAWPTKLATCFLHAQLFALDARSREMVRACSATNLMCPTVAEHSLQGGAHVEARGRTSKGGYDGRWWEFQANQVDRCAIATSRVSWCHIALGDPLLTLCRRHGNWKRLELGESGMTRFDRLSTMFRRQPQSWHGAGSSSCSPRTQENAQLTL